jgi:hypothetical protein
MTESVPGTVDTSDRALNGSAIKEEGTGRRFETRVEANVSGGSTHGSYSQIMNELNQVDAQAIGDAELAWKRTADLLRHIAVDLLPQAAASLDEAWADTASIKAQGHLQMAQGTLVVLADNCSQMQNTVGWAADAAERYTAIENRPYASGSLSATDPRTGALADSDINQDFADRYRNSMAATEYLDQFMQSYSQAATGLPSAVIADIPNEPDPKEREVFLEAPGAAVDASGKVAQTGIAGPSTGSAPAQSVSTGGVGAVGSMAALSDPFSTDGGSLAGAGGRAGLGGAAPGAVPGAGTGETGSAWGLGAGGAGVAGTSALGARALGSPGATGLTPGGLWGRSGMNSATGKPVVTPEALSNGRGTGTAAGAGSVRSGAGAGGVMAPMAGSGRGSDQEERERQSWLLEEDAWNIEVDASPPIISE